MNTPQFGYRTGYAPRDAALFDEGLRQHMLRVYNYMALGLVLTGVVAFTVSSVPALYVPIFSSRLKWVVDAGAARLRPALLVPHPDDDGGRRQAIVLGVLRRDWALHGLDLPGVHRDVDRPDLLHRRTMFGTMSLYGYTTRRT